MSGTVAPPANPSVGTRSPTDAAPDEAAVATKLRAIKAAHDADLERYNSLPLPTPEELSVELRTNAWLAACVYRVAQHRAMGFGGATMIVEHFEDSHLLDLAHEELVGVIPFLRRTGYMVTLYPDDDTDCPFTVDCVGNQFTMPGEYVRRLEECARGGRRYLVGLRSQTFATLTGRR